MGKTFKEDDLSSEAAYRRMRKSWAFNPATRIKPSAKVYKRGQSKQNFKKDLLEE